MLRGTLTLLTRSLRENARLRRAHLIRLVAVLILLGMLIEAHVSSGGFGAPGLRLFRSLCYLSIALISLAGLGFFASAISEEKEAGTLGLLKMADLSTVSIVLGKSTSRLAIALTVFAGELPFALLSIALGGMNVRQVWCASVAIAAYLVLVANIALLFSVLCRRTSSASVYLLLSLFVMLVALPAVSHARASLELDGLISPTNSVMAPVWDVSQFFVDISVITRINTILTTGFNESAFSAQVWASLFGALCCFVASCLAFDRFTEYVGATPGGDEAGFARSLLWRFRRPRPGRWPLVWKDFYFLAGGRSAIVLKTLLYLGLLGAIFVWHDWVWAVSVTSLRDSLWLVATIIAGCDLLVSFSRIYSSERTGGTLPCLFMLPRNMVSISYAKIAGCLIGCVPIALMYGMIVVLLPDVPFRDDEFFEQVMPACMIYLVLVHLTVFYSLIVSWGALPLAIGTMLVAGSCVVPIVAFAISAIYTSGQGPGGAFGPVLYTGVALSAVLQIGIAIRLNAVAAQ